MTVLKGYSNEAKLDRTKQQYVTVQPISPQQHGLDVVPSFVEQIGTDTVEAASTTSILNLTAHVAIVGDVIRFTDGALAGLQSRVVEKTVNTVTLGELLIADPSGLNLEILRHRYAEVDNTGKMNINATITSAPTQFVLDGVDQVVIEDTVDPLNNRPFPVKIIGASGSASEVTLAAVLADTTAILADTASLDGKITVCNTGAVTVAASALPTGAATEATLAALNGKVTAVNTGAVVVSSSALPTGAATEATLAAQSAKITACDTGAVVVASSALPADAATETTLALLNAKVTAVNTGAVVLATGANTIGNVNINSQYLDVVDFLDTPLLDASSTNITASSGVPVTVVASLASNVKKVNIMDTTGGYIGVYSDPAGTPVLEFIIGPGSDSTIECNLPAATVIGVRNMQDAAITSGILAINFIG